MPFYPSPLVFKTYANPFARIFQVSKIWVEKAPTDLAETKAENVLAGL